MSCFRRRAIKATGDLSDGEAAEKGGKVACPRRVLRGERLFLLYCGLSTASLLRAHRTVADVSCFCARRYNEK